MSIDCNSTNIHGIWFNFELIQGLMVVLVTTKNDEDPIKNEGIRVLTTLNINFQTPKGRLLHYQQWHLVEIQTHLRYWDIVVVLVTCKYEQHSIQYSRENVSTPHSPL